VALNQLHHLVVTAPKNIRERVRGLSHKDLLATCGAFRVPADDDSLPAITRLSMREVARRVVQRDEQIAVTGNRVSWLSAQAAPELVAIHGVGPDVASTGRF